MSEISNLTAQLVKYIERNANLGEIKPVLISLQDYVEALEADHATLKAAHTALKAKYAKFEGESPHVPEVVSPEQAFRNLAEAVKRFCKPQEQK